MKRGQKIKQYVICCMVGACFILMLPVLSTAEGDSQEPVVMKSESVKGTITIKRPEYIETKANHYLVDNEMKIYYQGPEKRQILLEDLPIPCNALLKYNLMNRGHSRLKEIVILEVISPSTIDWSPIIPE